MSDELREAASRRTKFALEAEADLRAEIGNLRACRAAEAKCGSDALFDDVRAGVRQKAEHILNEIGERSLDRDLPELIGLRQAAERLLSAAA